MPVDRRTSIRSSQLRNFEVSGWDIKNASISGSQKLIDGSVTDAKLDGTYVYTDGSRDITGDFIFGQNITVTGTVNGMTLYEDANNLLVGTNAMTSLTTGTSNTAVGNSASYRNQTGSDNVVIGAEASYTNDNLEGAVIIGYQADYNNLDGDFNVYIGYRAAYGTVSGSHSSNVGIGYEALNSITTGSDNVVMGYQAGTNLTIGAGNVLAGHQSGASLTTGLSNVLLGIDAGAAITATSYNVAIGWEAGKAFIENYGIFIGRGAGQRVSSATKNIYIGVQAGQQITTSNDNLIIGYQAGQFMTTSCHGNVIIGNQSAGANAEGNRTGQYNNVIIGFEAGYKMSGNDIYHTTLVGYQAGYSLTSDAKYSCFIGDRAGTKNTTGDENVAVGSLALRYNQTGAHNVVMGWQAGAGADGQSHSNNVLLGYKAAITITTGSNNIIMGYQAADNLTTGANNIIIGYDIDASAVDVSNELNIGGLLTGDLSAGAVGIGESDTQRGTLYLYGHTTGDTTGGQAFFYLSADHDASYEYCRIRMESAKWQFTRETGVALEFDTADGGWDFLLGQVNIGESDTTAGIVGIMGNGTTTGGTLRLFNGGNVDSPTNFWKLQPDTSGDLVIGTDDDDWIIVEASTGNIVQVASGTIDIGSASLPFKDLYLTGDSLYVAGTKAIGYTGGEVKFYGDGSSMTGVVSAHNDLTGLQGGDTAEFYHLNVHEEAQISATQSDILNLGTADAKVTLDSSGTGGIVTITASGTSVATFDRDDVVIGAGNDFLQITAPTNLFGMTLGGLSIVQFTDTNQRIGPNADTNIVLAQSADTVTFKAANVVEMVLGTGGMSLKTGGSVNTIETTLTDDDTHLPTSGAVVDAIGAVASGVNGWFDDGTNFRCTVEGGIITAIGASVGGGFNVA